MKVKQLNGYSVLVILLVSLIAACAKNDPAPDTPVNVPMSVINASVRPNDVFNFYLKGTRQTTTSVLNGAGTNFLQIPVGQQILSIKGLFDNQNYNNADTLLTFPYNVAQLGSTERYLFFVGGPARSSAFMVRDTAVTDQANALLKFVSVSAAVPAVTVYMNDTLRFTSKAFGGVNRYVKVGNGLKAIKIFVPGNTTPILTANVRLNVDSVYTLYSYGGSGANFRIGLLRGQ